MIRVMITVLLWSSIFSVQDAQAVDNGRPLYFSVIPKKNLDQQIAELHPLLDLLEKRLNRSIKIVRPQSYQSVIEGLVSHSIDFGVLGPASYAYAKRRDDRIDAFASFMMKNGYATTKGEYYNSILITRKQTGFSTVADLRGKDVALIDPASTSGSLIPNMEFAKEIGEPLPRFFAKQIYTGAHDRSVEAVMTGRVDAAFVASSRLDEEIRKGVVNGDDVRILWTSQPIHYDPFVFGGSLDDDVRNQIRAVFFSRDPSLTLLYENLQVKGLVPVDDQDYQSIHDIVARELEENHSRLNL
jgi:phosphonate transport system substrate-binding protein